MLPARRATRGLWLLVGSMVMSLCESSSGEPVSAGRYVAVVCGGFGDFAAALPRRSSQVRSLGPDASPAEQKRALRRLVNGLVQDAGRLVATLQAAGVPDVANGQDFADAIVAAGHRIRAILSDASDRIEWLPETDGFRPAAQALTESIQRAGMEITESLRTLGATPELDRAGEQEAACKSF